MQGQKKKLKNVMYQDNNNIHYSKWNRNGELLFKWVKRVYHKIHTFENMKYLQLVKNMYEIKVIKHFLGD